MKEEEKKERLENAKEFTWEVIKVVVISLAIIIPVRYFLIQPFYVKGASMEPNFHENQYLIIDELSYRFHEPYRGDVVVLHNPTDPSQFFIKRVIGLPGETIEVKNRHVYINGQEIDESAYLADTVDTFGNKKETLGENQYYVMGDNRNESLDSRRFGSISGDSIIGRTWLRAWPPNKVDHFSQVEYK
ncbi:MAG: signal peptidase I [Candidatus Kerfeldbacteria bacterium]|nr:signal peptidase I [Candidatus Kerfeldbacteria bacterium]